MLFFISIVNLSPFPIPQQYRTFRASFLIYVIACQDERFLSTCQCCWGFFNIPWKIGLTYFNWHTFLCNWIPGTDIFDSHFSLSPLPKWVQCSWNELNCPREIHYILASQMWGMPRYTGNPTQTPSPYQGKLWWEEKNSVSIAGYAA